MSISVSSPDSSTALSLIERACQQDPRAWESIVRIYGPMVYGWARRGGLSEEDSADILQNVFLTLTQHLSGFQIQQGASNFRGWLWTVTRNKIRDHFRSRQGKPISRGGSSAQQVLESIPNEMAESDSGTTQNELRRAWSEALRVAEADFEPKTWQAFWRTVIDEQSPQDVAMTLRMSVWAVYKARSRVLQRLRCEFGELL